MSFQAYLDNVEKKSGRIPADLVAIAHERGYGVDTKVGVMIDWLKTDFDLGRGHAMALIHVIRNGAEIDDEHVGTTGVHRDESSTLRLDGIANR
ncbi:DUF4287 domain-containing protein [Pseudonocardia abyssalis]|uniref:DUF4287 domain-containing protein n=1 Tax=Pseudonocardia abyssalis TaxID=2792008 RepID=A0ABS6UU46_9PSEU|nr:DUF4287 domain-containing protein [Pseudonocardia abyssalis]MBW0119580.1 DUF4287 domain-containing protein [Pseudonocardia abyssalis]MBW0135774.1 DUF4287 domain-containing protein [Pseudonocardia abyssalis]